MFADRTYLLLRSTPFLGFTIFVFSVGFPPFDDATEVDLSLHMLQHVLIVLSGVLIAYPLLRNRLRRWKITGTLSAASSAGVALLLGFWHLPGPWDAAVLNPGIHVIEHFSFLVVGFAIGSVLTLLSDSGKIGILLAAFFGHMAYAVVLISPWNQQVYSLYPLGDQVILGWALLLSGPAFIVGVAYVVARNPDWLGGTARGPVAPRKTMVDRAKVPMFLAPSISVILIVGLVSYFGYAAVAASVAPEPVSQGETSVFISETPISWQFSPQNVTVIVGVNSTVIWVSHSLSYDTVTDKSGTLDSGPIPPGGTFTKAFDVPGVYHYYCAYHPWMTGTIIVLGP